ncbi:hypothetical protein [uncultured Fibrella sp.]|uniref:hypothetical protein n=1 Tax=uncultured Fibrella sp. TaxID=1284596 RepID=UPI0035CA0178
MYSTRSGLVLGFHGCDQEVAKAVLNHELILNKSENKYDWLGPGVYFWENSPSRALEYAESLKKNPIRAKEKIKNPAVIGAVIDLGRCLDLLDYENLQVIRNAYDFLMQSLEKSNLPQNRFVGKSQELLLRELDCAVITLAHDIQSEAGLEPFDSTRAMFSEGEELYPHAGFRRKNHIQLCISNPNCIKGFFLPRKLDENFAKV